MKYDIIIAGVGGQGVLSTAVVLANAAMRSGLHAVQSEVHGMSQRGGAVIAHLRLSDREIHSATIGAGQADLVIGLEPLESLRYLTMLSVGGTVISATEPVKNIPNYPELNSILMKILELPRGLLVDATKLAREAGGTKSANTVLLGAAADFLPVPAEQLLETIKEVFAKNERVLTMNVKAFEAGRTALQRRESVDEFENLALLTH